MHLPITVQRQELLYGASVFHTVKTEFQRRVHGLHNLLRLHLPQSWINCFNARKEVGRLMLRHLSAHQWDQLPTHFILQRAYPREGLPETNWKRLERKESTALENTCKNSAELCPLIQRLHCWLDDRDSLSQKGKSMKFWKKQKTASTLSKR